MDVSVVVPVYNSARSLPVLVHRIERVLEGLAMRYELILVNDGSQDRSWDAIAVLAAERKWLRGIDLMRNYGQHNALLCGIRAACYEVVVTLDDDLQYPPEEIPRLLATLSEGHDVVYGTPECERRGLLRGVASCITKVALRTAANIDVAKNVSAFRAFRIQVRDAFGDYRSPFVSIDALLTWGTSRFGTVAIRHEPRVEGSSGYTVGKLVLHALNMMTAFSTVPLQFASVIGFAFTIFGIAVLVYVVSRYLFEGGSVAGFPFLASVIAIFSGAQLFTLGIIGEYLARMHFRMMERPPYSVRSMTRRT